MFTFSIYLCLCLVYIYVFCMFTFSICLSFGPAKWNSNEFFFKSTFISHSSSCGRSPSFCSTRIVFARNVLWYGRAYSRCSCGWQNEFNVFVFVVQRKFDLIIQRSAKECKGVHAETVYSISSFSCWTAGLHRRTTSSKSTTVVAFVVLRKFRYFFCFYLKNVCCNCYNY